MRDADGQPGDGLRIAFYTDAAERGGAEVSLRTLLAHLPPEILATVIGTDPDIVDWVAAARPGTAGVLVPRVRGKFSVLPILAHRRALARLRPHIVHCNLNEMADARWAVLVATTLRGARVVAVEHSPVVPSQRSVLALKRFGSRRLAAHVAVGDAAARATERCLGVAEGAVRTIHNGVADDVVVGNPPPHRMAVVGTLARLDPIKGLDVLVEAAAGLGSVHLLVVGDGPERAALETQVRDLGIEDRVELRPWVDDARRCLAELDVFVLPSRNEGFPLTVVEAMLAGRPVVASDVGSIGEAVVDGETGYLVPAGDVAALTAALARLVGDPDARERLGRAGRMRAQQRFTAPVMAAAYVQVYRELDAR